MSEIINSPINNSSNDWITNHSSNYVTTNRFYVEIASKMKLAFMECHGLGVKIQKNTYFEGGLNDQQRIFLGHAKYSDITLKRGVTDCIAFFEWVLAVEGQRNTRINTNIILFNQAGDVMISWELIGSIPIAWKISPLQAEGNSVVIEELTLAIEGLKLGKASTGGTLSGGRDARGFFASSSSLSNP